MWNRNSCRDMTARLGWTHGISPSHCAECQKCGTVDSSEAVAYRDTKINDLLSHFRQLPNLLKAHPQVIRAMLENHLTEVQASELTNHPEFLFSMTRKTRWDAVKYTWDMAHALVLSMASRGITSKKVELTIKGQRQKSCFGDETQAPCPALQKSKSTGRHFCNDCGCGESHMTYLDGDPSDYTKLDYPYLECPRAREGFSNHKPLTGSGD